MQFIFYDILSAILDIYNTIKRWDPSRVGTMKDWSLVISHAKD